MGYDIHFRNETIRLALTGDKSSRITTHYSAAEIADLIEAANKVCVAGNRPTLTLLKHFDQVAHAKVTQRDLRENGNHIENQA